MKTFTFFDAVSTDSSRGAGAMRFEGGQNVLYSPLSGSAGLLKVAPRTTEKRSSILATSSGHGGHGESPGMKLLISGGLTWAFEFGIGHYLEFLKIAKQTNPGSYLDITREITRHKGILGIWDGFLPWGTIQAVAKGGVFGFGHAMARKNLDPYVQNEFMDKGTAEVLAGGIGGGFQGLVLSPTLLLKTRVMTDPAFRGHMTPMESIMASGTIGWRVIKNEGLSALMKGSMVFSFKRVADWSTRFFFSVKSENVLFKKGDADRKLSTSQKVAASLLGGTLSTFVTIPIDVMVAQIQQASKAGEKVSVFQTFSGIRKQGGWGQVVRFSTRGFIARVTHVALTTALLKTASSAVYDYYQNMSVSRRDYAEVAKREIV